MNLFLAKSFMADISLDGRFRATSNFGFARAKNILNTKSPNDFRWSVIVASGYPIDVGIASKLPRRSIHSQDFLIQDVDPHCILFEPYATGLGFEITIFFWAHGFREIFCGFIRV